MNVHDLWLVLILSPYLILIGREIYERTHPDGATKVHLRSRGGSEMGVGLGSGPSFPWE